MSYYSSVFQLPLGLNAPPPVISISPTKLHPFVTQQSFFFSISNTAHFLPLKHQKKNLTFYCSNSSWEREEERWIREEQRWLREEKRWLREESRWNSERESLLQEISSLNFRIQALERQRNSPPPPPVEIMNRIPQNSSGPRSILFHSEENVVEQEEEEKLNEIMAFEKRSSGEEEKNNNSKNIKKISALRKGAQGEGVRSMQDALQKLGFYSGEEDMEFSSFSSGTERAVKTWQAALGAREDGIMTEELLERLFVEQGVVDARLEIRTKQKGTVPDEDRANGATIASVTETSGFQQTVVKEGTTEVESSRPRVFLLGENRWEEPSRLVGRGKLVGSSKMEVATTKCLACRGEGRLLCAECDGTGEPNVEPQFLEWVDEGANCPYCEGLGYNICDVCGGETTIIPVS